jgi:hypothetical protein
VKWGLALALCACNKIYGLDGTKPPPPDAPARCWEIGGTPFGFSEEIFQAFPQRCSDYHFTRDGAAVAMCDGDFASGRLDTALTTMHVNLFDVTSPQLTPDGMRAYLAEREAVAVAPGGGGSSSIVDFVMLERVGDTWIDRGLQRFVKPGEPSVFRGELHPRMIVFTFYQSQLEEYELVDGAWQHLFAHPGSVLQIALPGSFAVTGDGLRAVFPGQNMQMMYTDRPDLSSTFQRAVPLQGVPYVMRAQLTEDCGRVYYAGTYSVFFSQQRP